MTNHRIHTYVASYSHWTSAMREEMEQAILDAEKKIEAKHFAGRIKLCANCGRTYSNQGECFYCATSNCES